MYRLYIYIENYHKHVNFRPELNIATSGDDILSHMNPYVYGYGIGEGHRVITYGLQMDLSSINYA